MEALLNLKSQKNLGKDKGGVMFLKIDKLKKGGKLIILILLCGCVKEQPRMEIMQEDFHLVAPQQIEEKYLIDYEYRDRNNSIRNRFTIRYDFDKKELIFSGHIKAVEKIHRLKNIRTYEDAWEYPHTTTIELLTLELYYEKEKRNVPKNR